ncbi:hypothetical protein MRB53_038114 [Persea americana]|nr:hypothetical protein MRB53_038114 [Persea americana]
MSCLCYVLKRQFFGVSTYYLTILAPSDASCPTLRLLLLSLSMSVLVVTSKKAMIETARTLSGANAYENTSMLRRVLPAGKKLRVGIIGAGFAGLRAADVLIRRGAEVTIYEARDRLGGRVSTVRDGDWLEGC